METGIFNKADIQEMDDEFEDLEPNLTDLSEIRDTRESRAVAVFKDPQIQIKLEHPAILDHNSLENISIGNLSHDRNESENTSQSSDNAPTIIHSTIFETPALNQQHQRFSLREKRTSKFTNLCESQADNDNDIDTEFVREDSSLESSESEQEHKIRNTFVHTNVRKRKILTREPLNPQISKSKILIIKCEICSRDFASFLKKDYHFKKHHDLSMKTEKGIYRCKKFECTAYLLSYQQLHFHYEKEHRVKRKTREGNLAVDKTRFPCSICGKCFPGNLSLNTHLEYHKDPSEWKWECGLCGKKSATEYKLKDHMRTHTNEKPYKCRFCKDSFRSDYMYKEHLIMEHSDKDDIKAALQSKRFRVKGSKGFSERKLVKRRRIGKCKCGMDRKQVEEKEKAVDESGAFEVKKECIADRMFNELEEKVMDGYDEESLGEQGDVEIESVDEEMDEENKDEREGEVEEMGKTRENVNAVMDGVTIGGVNIFRKGKYFGDGTLAELEDLE